MKQLAAIGLCAFAGLTVAAQRGTAPATAPKKAAVKAAPAKPAAPKPIPVTAISIDPVNPHYLRFRGRTVVLVTSGEHYGAVLNPAFDYVKYLDELREEGMSLTRVFDGSFIEAQDTRMYTGGARNTLAPADRYLAPWPRAGGKFDLEHWNDDYFNRLKDFVGEAGKRGIAVEITLFSTNYGTGEFRWGSWNLNPLNAANNINGVGKIGWDRFNTLEDEGIVAAQDALTRKTVRELNGFDNVYYEICNEPYFSGASATETRKWEDHLAATLRSAETDLPVKHLIAENTASGYAEIRDANPAISIYNFHEAYPPAAVPLNWNLKKPIGFDQTRDGCSTLDRRREAWAFVLSGGAIYDNADPSFTVDDPTGKGPGSCQGLRYTLRILSDFISGFDLAHLQPGANTVRQWPQFSSEMYEMEDPGHVYAVYLKGGNDSRATAFTLEAPAGRYETEWVNPRTGETVREPAAEHSGGAMKIASPEYSEDLAMKLIRVGDLPAAKPTPAPKAVPKAAPKALPRPITKKK